MRVPDVTRRCVAFICYRDREGLIKFAGTCLFLAMKYPGLDGFFQYTITAKHVIIGIRDKSIDGKVLLRVNKKSGGVENIETDQSDWFSNPDDPTDVSVLRWAPPVGGEFSIMHLDTEYMPAEIPLEAKFGFGDEVFIVGLFTSHAGTNRNIPIVRIGNIAAIPEEKVPTRHFGEIEAYLIECRSIGGLSGSPVFVHIVSPRVDDEGKAILTPIRYIYLLGIIHGHYDAPEPEADASVEDDPKNEAVNMGIAVVVPAKVIMETLNHPRLVKEREKELKEFLKRNAPTPDTAEDSLG